MTSLYLHKSFNQNRKAKCIHKVGTTTIDLLNPPPTKEAIEKIHFDDKTMLVPSRYPREHPKLFKKDEYSRLQTQAKVITAAEKQAMIEQCEQEKRNKEIESSIRKEKLKNAALEQTMKEGKKLTKLESKAMKQTSYLLQRAFNLRQEQQDEVKHANRLILASKCLAIRAAQVTEKELIKKELNEEEQRLDNMMEEQRRISLQKEEEKRQADHRKNQKFVNAMMQQIKEKEIERLQEGERIEEEARLQNRALIQMQRDEDVKRQILLKKQSKFRADLALANEEIARFKQVEKEENRIAELRVQEFMKKKAEREEALAEEIRQQKLAKELETGRLRAAREQATDAQAARDEMNALRVQEEVEREWRIKEKRNAEKKKQEMDNLKLARRKQIEDIRKQQAVALQREREDFFKIVQVQKELEQKEKEKQENRKKENLKHRREILLQVNEKERQRIVQRKEKFEEGLGLKAEADLRTRYINTTLKSKMSQLRANKVPESVVKDIERQLKL